MVTVSCSQCHRLYDSLAAEYRLLPVTLALCVPGVRVSVSASVDMTPLHQQHDTQATTTHTHAHTTSIVIKRTFSRWFLTTVKYDSVT